jgi:hypothetical protein
MSRQDKIKAALQRIYERHGMVTASLVLDEARPESSDIHEVFEWDDAKAGHEFRLIQARTYIREVKIEVSGKQERLIHVPSITKGEGKYQTESVVVENPDEFERALDAAVSKLHGARKAVDELRNAAERDPTNSRVSLVSQISRGLEIMEAALQIRH